MSNHVTAADEKLAALRSAPADSWPNTLPPAFRDVFLGTLGVVLHLEELRHERLAAAQKLANCFDQADGALPKVRPHLLAVADSAGPVHLQVLELARPLLPFVRPAMESEQSPARTAAEVCDLHLRCGDLKSELGRLPVFDDPCLRGADHWERRLEKEVVVAQMRAIDSKPKRQRVRRKRKQHDAAVSSLTPIQAETVHMVGECEGDVAKAARRLGKDRKTVQQSYESAMAKLGKVAVTPRTVGAPQDKSGQCTLSEADDRRGM